MREYSHLHICVYCLYTYKRIFMQYVNWRNGAFAATYDELQCWGIFFFVFALHSKIQGRYSYLVFVFSFIFFYTFTSYLICLTPFLRSCFLCSGQKFGMWCRIRVSGSSNQLAKSNALPSYWTLNRVIIFNF